MIVDDVCVDEHIDATSFAALSGRAEANTVFNYMYRDADNYKQFGRTVFPGEITRSQVETILKNLNMHDGFVPGQIGMDDLQGKFFNGWSDVVDHPFHEIGGFELTLEAPDTDRDLPSLVGAFTTVDWNTEYRP